jgi:hypothetical protein
MDRHLIAMIGRTGYGRPRGLVWRLMFFNGDAVRPKVPEGHTMDLE